MKIHNGASYKVAVSCTQIEKTAVHSICLKPLNFQIITFLCTYTTDHTAERKLFSQLQRRCTTEILT